MIHLQCIRLSQAGGIPGVRLNVGAKNSHVKIKSLTDFGKGAIMLSTKI